MTITSRLLFAFAFTFTLAFNLFTLIAAENIHTVKCPCFGSISIPRAQATHTAYDLIVRRLDHPSRPLIDNRLSRRNVILTESKYTRTDSVFHRVDALSIPVAGMYSITMVPSVKSSVPAPDTMINIKSTVRRVSCPVLLSVQLPEFRGVIRMATQGVRKEGPAHEIQNREFVRTDRQFEFNEVELSNSSPLPQGFVNRDLLPFIAAVVGPPSRQTVCTGAILSERWVVTTAHCGTTTDFTVFVSASQALVDGVGIPIKNVFNNPRYGPNGRDAFWDIALIELEKSVTTEAGISSFMKVNFNSAFPADGAIVRVAGFGVLPFGAEVQDSFPRRLRQIDLPVVTNRRCKLEYRRATSVVVSKRWQFCSGFTGDGCDSCQGDAGGSVIQYVGQQPILLGLVSSGGNCIAPGFPSINTRVSAFRSFFLSSGAVFTEHTGNIPQVRRDCPAGTFLFSSGSNVANCLSCPSSGFSAGGLARLCTLCPPGTSQDPNNGARCI